MSVLSTLESDAAKAAKYAGPMATALGMIAAAIGVGATAGTALPIIVGVIDALAAGVAGDVDAATVLADLGKLSSGIKADDAAADAAVAAKFPTT